MSAISTTRQHLMVAFSWYVGAACLACAIGLSVTAARPIAFAATAIAIAGTLALAVPARGLVALFLVYLPLEGFVLTQLPATVALYARYAPEAAVWVGALAVLVRGGVGALRRGRGLFTAVAVLVVVWTLCALWDRTAVLTAVIGFRSEFRFLPLCLVVMATDNPSRDGRLYARVIVWSAAVQSAIALTEIVGGATVRAFFAPHYTLDVGGVQVATTGAVRLGSISGTFNNYNDLSICLLFGAITLICAGRGVLGYSRTVIAFGVVVFSAIIGVSGSREATLGLAIVILILGRRRLRLPSYQMAAIVCVAALLFGHALAQSQNITHGSRSTLSARWEAVLNPATYTPNSGANFRLSLLATEASLTRERPVVGFGPGSVVDPRSLTDGTNPLYRSAVGVEAIAFSYLFDNEWGLILIQVGVAGLVALVVVLLVVGRIGLRAAELGYWAGDALVAGLAACIVLGFFTAILELRQPMGLFWTLVGLCAAARAASASVDPTGAVY